ncbi:ribosome biogenesis GTP-binding protein YihA/YsxC [Gluconobacter cerinus]|uniref:ribosome biogenesis GTP-binding protein YihA/YsxC n=1 Tax=Gluconobacter cerinus TaxID=38307 RepID=UPI001B8C412C|nr:ribosome biogenesis GTP-binding protein YihA/YsxC [Gluconobacter cerinus]MBS1024768.1 YihA family ribosome biogenesis GTP-binding protein [Gluconobacter cerinus]MBS1043459.1 YihA family ribosome biogenesis GTP-binding protein [Gluconobacter cerinus]
MKEAAGPPTPEQIEDGRLLFAGECEFFFGSQKIDQLPPVGRPEVAFAGRSNVGKSSIINALTGRRALARASSEPGRTKQLNFFNLADRISLVDMPGYGFAKAAKSVKEDWQNMMFAYLRGRTTLARVILLLDARIEIKQSDRDVMDLLGRAAVVFQIVLTKCDQVRPTVLKAKIAEVEAIALKQAAAYPRIVCTSSQTGEGIEDLRAEIARFADPVQTSGEGDVRP